jgi:hypothetical protein
MFHDFRFHECRLLAEPTVQPKTAFSPFSPVHSANPEGQLRVDFVEKVACRDDALLIHFSR